MLVRGVGPRRARMCSVAVTHTTVWHGLVALTCMTMTRSRACGGGGGGPAAGLIVNTNRKTPKSRNNGNSRRDTKTIKELGKCMLDVN